MNNFNNLKARLSGTATTMQGNLLVSLYTGSYDTKCQLSLKKGMQAFGHN